MDTQSKVWSHINQRLKEEKIESDTDNYYDLLSHKSRTQKTDYPVCEADKGCNGIAVMLDNKVVNIDLFGTEDVYKFYFPRLRDSALRKSDIKEGAVATDIHEAYFKVLDLLDNYEKETGIQDTDHSGVGSFYIVEKNEFVGFNLTMENQLIHNVVFSK